MRPTVFTSFSRVLAINRYRFTGCNAICLNRIKHRCVWITKRATASGAKNTNNHWVYKYLQHYEQIQKFERLFPKNHSHNNNNNDMKEFEILPCSDYDSINQKISASVNNNIKLRCNTT